MTIQIRQAEIQDLEGISGVLIEAAEWLRGRGIPLWRAEDFAPERLSSDVVGGVFFVAESGGQMVGAMKFQLEDELFWPDFPVGEAAFVHRLAVRRAFAGGGVSGTMLRWAADRARSQGRRFLRLDCDASRARLRTVYEQFGFRHHSDRQVGPFFAARYEQELL